MSDDTEHTESGAPAGWYPDPERVSTMRYWDGEAWTDHITQDTRGEQRKDDVRHDATLNRVALVIGLCFLVPVLAFTFVPASVSGFSCGTWISPEFNALGLATKQANLALAGGNQYDSLQLAAIGTECNNKLDTRRLLAFVFVGAGVVARIGIPYAGRRRA